MALLIIDLDKYIGSASAWRDTFGEQLPDLEIRVWPEAGNLTDIEYLAFMHPDFDSLPVFPYLKAMFSRSAGVLWPEPLPPTSSLWLHPKVTVMPHVARRPTVAQLVTEIAANIRSLEAGRRPLQEIDITLGY